MEGRTVVTYDIAVVGGGASGLAAAIAAGRGIAARRASTQANSASVCILEASDRVGRTILKTGNGRCNFSNEHIAHDNMACGYHNAPFVQEALQTLARMFSGNIETPPDPVCDFFEEIGLAWRQEADGRRYPLANKASVVVDVLRAAAAKAGVEEVCDAQVVGLEIHQEAPHPFMVRLSDNRLVHARSVVLACGASLPSHFGLDHLAYHEPKPVLGPLRCSKKDQGLTRQLDNIRVKCDVALMRPGAGEASCVGQASGEVLFRSYGLSGICIFDLSRMAHPGDFVQIDVLQLGNRQAAHDYLRTRAEHLVQTFGAVNFAGLLRGLVLPRVADVVLGQAGIEAESAVDQAGIGCVADLLSGWAFEVEGIGPTEQCQVQRGGFAVESFDPHTMQARTVGGLYAAGEALDVDGPCGGYNLHWAWASGLLAGTCAAKQLA